MASRGRSCSRHKLCDIFPGNGFQTPLAPLRLWSCSARSRWCLVCPSGAQGGAWRTWAANPYPHAARAPSLCPRGAPDWSVCDAGHDLNPHGALKHCDLRAGEDGHPSQHGLCGPNRHATPSWSLAARESAASQSGYSALPIQPKFPEEHDPRHGDGDPFQPSPPVQDDEMKATPRGIHQCNTNNLINHPCLRAGGKARQHCADPKVSWKRLRISTKLKV